MPRLDGKADLITGDGGAAAYSAPKGSVRSLVTKPSRVSRTAFRSPRTDLRGHDSSGVPERCALPIAGNEEQAWAVRA